MAETTKKAKAPAKPKKSAAAPAEPVKAAAAKETKTPKAAGIKAETPAAPAPLSHEEVARVAHRFWAERGHQHGQHVDDWFRAEQELRNKAS